MKSLKAVQSHIEDLTRYVAEAKSEHARCLARNDAFQARIWAAKAEKFEKSLEFWKTCAASFPPHRGGR